MFAKRIVSLQPRLLGMSVVTITSKVVSDVLVYSNVIYSKHLLEDQVVLGLASETSAANTGRKAIAVDGVPKGL